MAEYITLLGAEDVRRAAHEMKSAAEGMGQAAMNIEDSLFRHRQWADAWLCRLEAALAAGERGREGE